MSASALTRTGAEKTSPSAGPARMVASFRQDKAEAATDGEDEEGFAENERHDAEAGEAERFQHADLEGAFAHGKDHGVDDDHQEGDESRADDEVHDQPDIGILAEKGFQELLFRLRACRRGRVGEKRVDAGRKFPGETPVRGSTTKASTVSLPRARAAFT